MLEPITPVPIQPMRVSPGNDLLDGHRAQRPELADQCRAIAHAQGWHLYQRCSGRARISPSTMAWRMPCGVRRACCAKAGRGRRSVFDGRGRRVGDGAFGRRRIARQRAHAVVERVLQMLPHLLFGAGDCRPSDARRVFRTSRFANASPRWRPHFRGAVRPTARRRRRSAPGAAAVAAAPEAARRARATLGRARGASRG